MTEYDQDDTAGSALTAKQETFIMAMLSAPSIVEAARITGINEKTARRWLKLPEVRTAYQGAQREVYDASLTTLKLAVHDAVSVLTQTMKDELTPASTRVRAAQIVIEQAVELQKMSELEQKLVELEQRLQQQGVR